MNQTLMDLVIFDAVHRIAKEPHPSGPRPIKPNKNDFKNEQKLNDAMAKYAPADDAWMNIDIALKTYHISKMRCESGIVIENMAAIDYSHHVGKKIKAELLLDGTVMDDAFKQKN